jgi:hypothetical protein
MLSYGVAHSWPKRPDKPSSSLGCFIPFARSKFLLTATFRHVAPTDTRLPQMTLDQEVGVRIPAPQLEKSPA